METLRTVRKSAVAATTFFVVFAGLSTSYAALVAGLTSGDLKAATNQLSSASWNRIVNSVLELDARTSPISTSGTNVGIGVASPTYGLEVAGTVKGLQLNSIGSVGTDLVRIQPGNDLNPTYNALTIGNAAWTQYPVQLKKNGDAYFAGTVTSNGLNSTGNVTMGWEHITASCTSCASVTANCTAGKYAIGGGCEPGGAWSTVYSAPRDTGYTCATQTAVPTFSAHVYCANIR